MGLLREAQRLRAEQRGFEDALEIGRPNQVNMPDWERVAYDNGFERGKRAERRIVALAQGSRGGNAG